MKNIRDDIVADRRRRVAAKGHAEGVSLPARRAVPLTPFLARSGVICEIKRRSPSKGAIAPNLDAAEQAGVYAAAGVENFSVLTESGAFGGSLEDLVRVKQAFPERAVLRKDFLFDPEDIDVAWRAGADAVLLIAGMLEAERLADLHRRAEALGMAVLVELHDAEDIGKARTFRPTLLGINSRDLTTFAIDPLLPLKVKAGIDWPARVVYESGIARPGQAAFAAAAGFAGVLVGEGAVRDPSLPAKLLEAMQHAAPARFWPETAARLARAGGAPLVKLCGFAREADVRLAAEAGADILGFVFWPSSPRRADAALVRAVADVPALKVGVTVGDGTGLDPELARLLADGLLDAVQFHGAETPAACGASGFPYYKVLRPANAADLTAADAFDCPRLLLDASGPVPGGTGTPVAADLLAAWRRPLWLAGGLSPENVGAVVERWRPELVDAASGVEDAPGVKNGNKIRQFIKEARHVRR